VHFTGEAYGPVVTKERGEPGVQILKREEAVFLTMLLMS
jgi:hypothetical protein